MGKYGAENAKIKAAERKYGPVAQIKASDRKTAWKARAIRAEKLAENAREIAATRDLGHDDAVQMLLAVRDWLTHVDDAALFIRNMELQRSHRGHRAQDFANRPTTATI